MSPDETRRILLRLNEAFHRDSGPGELAMWTEAIRGCEYAVALEATGLLVRAQDRFPTISRFLETVQSVSRRRSLDQQAAALPAPWPEENVAKRGLAEAREALAAAKDRAKHGKQTKCGGRGSHDRS